jgi:hypothetical protein
MRTVDPEEEPYRSKYAARDTLQSYVSDLERKSRESSAETRGKDGAGDEAARTDAEPLSISDKIAICKCKLGINFLLTEENTAAEKPLIESADHISSVLSIVRTIPVETLLQLVCTGLEACNYLALLYSGWDTHSKALDRLVLGKGFFDVLKVKIKTIAAASLDKTSEKAGAPKLTSEQQKLLASADSLYTHTLFYLAQVHGHLGSSALTHRYIETTLQRQLNEERAQGTKRKFRRQKTSLLPHSLFPHLQPLRLRSIGMNGYEMHFDCPRSTAVACSGLRPRIVFPQQMWCYRKQ